MSSRNVLDLKRKKSEPRKSAPAVYRTDLRKRPSSLRVRRRREKALMALIVILLIACVVCAANYLSYLPQVTIASVQVQGAETFPSRVLAASVGTILDDGTYHLLSRQNILLYPKSTIEHAIVADYPRIATAEISRSSLFSRDLTLKVTERQPFATWCRSLDATSSCYVMDQGGFIFAPSASSTMSYIFSGGVSTSSEPIGQTFAPGHVPGLLALIKLLSQQDALTPLGASIENDQDFSVQFAQGFSLKASFGENAETLAHDLSLVLGSNELAGLESQLDYVDLRFGDRVYYKLKGEAATSTPR